MSNTFRIRRKRWAARDMRVQRWLAPAWSKVDARQPICELLVDGATELVVNSDDEHLTWTLYWHYLDEGEEVPPSADLFEYTYTRGEPARQDHYNPRPRPLRYIRRPSYAPVFLSYRRSDSDAWAGRLHERLEDILGAGAVFMDQFSIAPGEPFPWAIQQAAAHCAVMVVLIGPQWLTALDARGRRRIDDDSDFTRREIVAALDRRISVIPVMLPQTGIPSEADLPTDLKGLQNLQMLPVSIKHWRSDVDDLVKAVRACLPEPAE